MLPNAIDTESYPIILQKEQNFTNKQDDQETNALSNETTTTSYEELQETLAETTKLPEEKKQHYSKIIRGTLK